MKNKEAKKFRQINFNRSSSIQEMFKENGRQKWGMKKGPVP